MALTYIKGTDLTLNIGPTGALVSYSNVASSATLTVENEQTVLETLGGRAYKTVNQNATLDIELYQDWGSTSPTSVCKTLWDQAKANPDTVWSAVLVANGVTFTMDILPNYPDMGGAATDVLTTPVSFVVYRGIVTRTP